MATIENEGIITQSKGKFLPSCGTQVVLTPIITCFNHNWYPLFLNTSHANNSPALSGKKRYNGYLSSSRQIINTLIQIIMQKIKQISLYITIILWAMIIGGVMYSHIVYFPPYLSHLPASNQLITGEYGLQDKNFWMFIHPLSIAFTITTLVLNWKSKARRKFILIAAGIYALAILFTAVYFLPRLVAFAETDSATNIIRAELFQRGQAWQHRSWIRGASLCFGFIMLLVALEKKEE